jgi:DNA helicase-2/ATP-dependent DNA helicase PcrA
MDDAPVSDPLLEDLTDAQREAVQHVDGPLLIIAAAGSGKTRVITRRVAYLIHQGIVPAAIAAITFTNKAAAEMRSRVAAALDRPLRDFGRLDQPWPMVCTFHSLCLRILKHYASRIGLAANFSIFDSADQNKLIKEALKLLDMSSMNFPPSTIHAAISNAKNKLLSPQAFSAAANEFYSSQVARVYVKYQTLLEQNNGLDFDDLLLRTAQAMRDFPDVLAELQERFQYLLIDEYQDTNHAQYIVAHALAQKHRNICVVGDPDQSIYAWRGADIQNILDFEKDYPDAKVVRLEQNYRSTKTILAIASELIDHNVRRKQKRLWTENPQGEPATVFLAGDEHDEAALVMQELRRLHDEMGYDWSSMAIFYRVNALSRVMEDSLRHANVPYQIARGVEFYNRKEIKDVLAYLRVVANPADTISLDRIINVPARGLGDAAMKKVAAYATANGLSMWEALERGGGAAGLSTRAVQAIHRFVQMVKDWRQQAASPGNVRAIAERIVRESGYETLLIELGGEEQEQIANVNELISSTAEYDKGHPEGTLGDYLAMVTLVSDADHMQGAGGAITLMTLHAAKGLEFSVVAMIGLEDGLLPHSRARFNPAELEEERRLCFVGMTRAQERLILSKAAVRTIRGSRQSTITSPFFNEIPVGMVRVFDRGRSTGLTAAHAEEIVAPTGLRRGQRVRHPSFGLGRIAELTERGSDTRAVIDFETAGRKTLVLEYTKLTPVA